MKGHVIGTTRSSNLLSSASPALFTFALGVAGIAAARKEAVPCSGVEKAVVSVLSTMAGRILAGIILLGTILAPQEIVSAAGPISPFNMQSQTGCEAEMLGNMGAREVFSGKAYGVLTEISRAYGRAIPHIYIFPGSWNMAYMAGSTAVAGRGKIRGRAAGDVRALRYHRAQRLSGARDGAPY